MGSPMVGGSRPTRSSVTAGIEDIFDPRGGGDHIAGVERMDGWKSTP